MSAPSLLQLKPHGGHAAPFLARQPDAPLVNLDPKSNRRAKIWDISPVLHCSIIGTCLTAGELRQFLGRFQDSDASATDHALHSRGVRAAGRHDAAGKLLHKLLDNRHDAAVKRFAKATTTAEVRALWLQAFEQGGIPGAYWAVLTHPATERPLVEEVFGQVHMLSHMVGSSNRIDITRLRYLERQLQERDAKIARQESRLSAGAADRSELQQRIVALDSELRRRSIAEAMTADPGSGDAASLLQRVDTEKAHAAVLAARVAQLEEQLQGARKFAATLQKQNGQLASEIAVLESALRVNDLAPDRPELAGHDLQGVTLLYVGGRPGLIEQLKAQCARRGGVLLAHDGGIEDNSAALPGLVSRADAAFFPVDCVSHRAAGQIKKLCRDIGKPFVPLRSASVASFMAATSDGFLYDAGR